MVSRTRTVSKSIVTRDWRDIDPKIAVVAGLTLVADVVLVALYLTGAIDGPTLAAGVGPSSIAVVAGYLKRSTDVDLPAAAASAAEVVAAVAPLVEFVAPEAKAAVEVAADGIAAIEEQLRPQAPAPVAYRI